MIVGGHLVWGAALGLVYAAMQRRNGRSAQARAREERGEARRPEPV